jgi:hypothetical protein
MIMATCDPESFVLSYVEHLDPLGDTVEASRRKWHAVRKALEDMIRCDGQVQPWYNKMRNSWQN